jgi:glycosyltransferase involved in cell wall biosynthesis
MKKISVVLNGYKRLHHLDKQVKHVKEQSVQPHEILLWQNGTQFIDKKITEQFKYSKSNYNFGVWARFAYALNSKSEYICVFDDDTIPGNRWLENCLNTIETHDGLLGTVGLRYQSTTGYYPHTSHGWRGPSDSVTEVDIVGHAWFFRRDWLSYFWRELPDINGSFIIGEDIHFSHMLQKYGNIGTFVPPHPSADTSLWGSLPEYASKIGTDEFALSYNNTNVTDMNTAYLKAIQNGFKPLKFR